MTLSPITKSQVFTKSWNLMYSALVDNLTDPESRGDNNDWIFSAFPSGNAGKTSWQYPIIVIEPVDISFKRLTVDPNYSTSKRLEIHSFTIDVYSKSAAVLDSISDDIQNSLNTISASLRTNGLKNLELVGTDYSPPSSEEVKIHNKTFNFEAQRID